MMIHKQEYLLKDNKRYESTALGLSRLEFMVRSTCVSSVKKEHRKPMAFDSNVWSHANHPVKLHSTSTSKLQFIY